MEYRRDFFGQTRIDNQLAVDDIAVECIMPKTDVPKVRIGDLAFRRVSRVADACDPVDHSLAERFVRKSVRDDDFGSCR